jgi:hypothetical protein
LAAADNVAKGVGPSNEHEKALDFANYFSSYGYIYHQKDMLQVHATGRLVSPHLQRPYARLPPKFTAAHRAIRRPMRRRIKPLPPRKGAASWIGGPPPASALGNGLWVMLEATLAGERDRARAHAPPCRAARVSAAQVDLAPRNVRPTPDRLG